MITNRSIPLGICWSTYVRCYSICTLLTPFNSWCSCLIPYPEIIICNKFTYSNIPFFYLTILIYTFNCACSFIVCRYICTLHPLIHVYTRAWKHLIPVCSTISITSLFSIIKSYSRCVPPKMTHLLVIPQKIIIN